MTVTTMPIDNHAEAAPTGGRRRAMPLDRSARQANSAPAITGTAIKVASTVAASRGRDVQSVSFGPPMLKVDCQIPSTD